MNYYELPFTFRVELANSLIKFHPFQDFKSKDLEPYVKAMYMKLELFVQVLTYQVLSSSKIGSPGPIYLIKKASSFNSNLPWGV